MSWKNLLYSVLFVLSFSLFTQFAYSLNVSALDYTYDYNNFPDYSDYVYFCGGSTGVNCTDYDTFSFSISDPPLNTNWSFSSVFYYSYNNCSGNGTISSRIDFFVHPNFANYIGDFTCNLTAIYIGQSYTPPPALSNSTFTFSLTNSSGGVAIIPSGSLSITENGTFDVTNYAEAVVNVSSDAPYTGILEGIKVSILTCGAIIVVLYFFYCFYRIIIKTTGGK